MNLKARVHTYGLSAVLVCAFASLAEGGTLHVRSHGDDSGDCGPRTSPCRSISQAIANAEAGDTIVVGPGRYGDLNSNGVIGEPGEESGAPGCDCLLAVDKRVIIRSNSGAAATVIDARTVDSTVNVQLIAKRGAFGMLGQGFTVTHTGIVGNSYGIWIDGANVAVQGNEVVCSYAFGTLSPSDACRTGIYANAAVLISGNQVTAWVKGIYGSPFEIVTVSRNYVSGNVVGISAEQGSVEGNVVTANQIGIDLTDTARAIGNAVYLNASGIQVRARHPDLPPADVADRGIVQKNNIFGNFNEEAVAGVPGNNCGLRNFNTTADATNNYWGVPTGPGPQPADDVCNSSGATTITTPFAAKPFTIVPLKP